MKEKLKLYSTILLMGGAVMTLGGQVTLPNPLAPMIAYAETEVEVVPTEAPDVGVVSTEAPDVGVVSTETQEAQETVEAVMEGQEPGGAPVENREIGEDVEGVEGVEGVFVEGTVASEDDLPPGANEPMSAEDIAEGKRLGFEPYQESYTTEVNGMSAETKMQMILGAMVVTFFTLCAVVVTKGKKKSEDITVVTKEEATDETTDEVAEEGTFE